VIKILYEDTLIISSIFRMFIIFYLALYIATSWR